MKIKWYIDKPNKNEIIMGKKMEQLRRMTQRNLFARVALFTIVGCMTLASCNGKDRPVLPEPTPDPKPEAGEGEKEPEVEEPTTFEVAVEAYVKEKNGVLRKIEHLEEDQTNYGYGSIVGGGQYKKSNIVVVSASINDFLKHSLIAVYEKDGKGGFTEDKGLVDKTQTILEGYKSEKNISAELTFQITENMTFVVVFEDYVAPPIQFATHESHSYWAQKNKEATAYIKPRIKRYSSPREAMLATNITLNAPQLDESMVERTIYRESPLLIDYNTRVLKPIRRTRGEWDKLTRYTYALMTLSGEVVEIFPPSYNNDGFISTLLTYVTAPEGTYRVALLWNQPSNREVWHLIPIISTFTEFDELYCKSLGWKEHTFLPEGQNWWRDTDIIYVKNREKESDNVPIWGNPRVRELKRVTDVEITISVTNISNQRIEGDVIIADGYKKWFHEEGRALMDQRMQMVWKREGKGERHMYDTWEFDRGIEKVRLEPYETKEVTYLIKDRTYAREKLSGSFPTASEAIGSKRYSWDSFFHGFHTTIYWEGVDRKRERMLNGCQYELNTMRARDWGSLSSRHIWTYSTEFDEVGKNWDPSDCVRDVIWPNATSIYPSRHCIRL